VDRRDYYFLQLLSESELDDGFEQAEQADRAVTVDAGLVGIHQGGSVSERSGTPDLNVEVAACQAYNQAGERMNVPSLQLVDMSTDNLSVSTDVAGGGNEKIVSLFLKFERALSDPRIDGNTATVYFNRDESFSFFIVQGSESSPPPTPPALESDKILLADVRRDFGQTQILNADITPPGGTYTTITNRRESAFDISAGAIEIKAGTPEESDQEILTELNNHVTGASNLHPAASIDYAGGAAWLDSTTNPAATAEAQFDKVITDLIDTAGGGNSGADKLGSGALAGWRGGRSRASGSIWDQLEAVGVDLSAQTAADDGAERIGAEAHTAAGAGIIDLALGSVRSQLNELSDAAAAHALDQLIAGSWAFSGQLNAVTDGGIALGVGSVAATRFARRFSRLHASWSHYVEDFIGIDALGDLTAWEGGGTVSPVMAADGLDGIIDVQTGAGANNTSVLLHWEANYFRDRGLVFEAVVQPDATSTVKLELGFTTSPGATAFDAASQDGVYIKYDTGPGDSFWILAGNANGSVTTNATTTAPSAATRVRLTIVCATDGSAELFVNGVSEATIAAASVGNTNGNMYLKVRAETLTAATRKLEVDSIAAWQDRLL